MRVAEWASGSWSWLAYHCPVIQVACLLPKTLCCADSRDFLGIFFRDILDSLEVGKQFRGSVWGTAWG